MAVMLWFGRGDINVRYLPEENMANGNERIDIYFKRAGNYDRHLKRFAQEPISQANKQAIMRLHSHLFAKGAGKLRVAKASSQAVKLAKLFKKDFVNATKQDVEQVVAAVNNASEWRDATKADYRRILKSLFLWLIEEELCTLSKEEQVKLLKYVKSIKRTYKEEKVDYNGIITEEDVAMLTDRGCRSAKERAFLNVLHEGGFRIGEMLNIRLKDVKTYSDRTVIQVDGKTGMRQVPLFVSCGYLTQWLTEHPLKNDENAFLWAGSSNRYGPEPIVYIGATKLVRRIFDRSDCTKQHNLHWFRHSRATVNSAFMTEQVMCKFFGWVLGSGQVRAYVHANLTQVEDSIRRMRGITTSEAEATTAKNCPRCNTLNSSSAKYCQRCSSPLSVEIAHTEGEYMKLAFKIIEKIMANPLLKKEFEEFQNKKKILQE